VCKLTDWNPLPQPRHTSDCWARLRNSECPWDRQSVDRPFGFRFWRGYQTVRRGYRWFVKPPMSERATTTVLALLNESNSAINQIRIFRSTNPLNHNARCREQRMAPHWRAAPQAVRLNGSDSARVIKKYRAAIFNRVETRDTSFQVWPPLADVRAWN